MHAVQIHGSGRHSSVDDSDTVGRLAAVFEERKLVGCARSDGVILGKGTIRPLSSLESILEFLQAFPGQAG